MNNEESWVAKWLEIGGDNFLPGCYCLKIQGELSQDLVHYLKDHNIKIVPNIA